MTCPLCNELLCVHRWIDSFDNMFEVYACYACEQYFPEIPLKEEDKEW